MSIGISTAELAAMRAEIALMLPDACTIQQPTETVDASGASTFTYATVTGGSVACRLDPINSRAQDYRSTADREALSTDRLLTVPYNAPLAAGYRIAITGGQTYEIVGLIDDHSWRVCRRAYVAVLR